MKRTLIVAATAAPCLLALSYPWRDATHGAGAALSSIGWFGFLLALVIVAVTSATLGLRRLRTHAA
ncbi:hypothetical protein [Ornithinimicrobium avium]|uniref:Uncharacterized protein n=1 Tax=Ornithinimicrobium avium TaxID=2283195 RepID=A0A345NNW8_9MICO|nr:hypothetical protein [Ornithinimicrobium avium]AXH96726.1 hypothetical protein DV701_11895 [Ornithinimicrobium avium]